MSLAFDEDNECADLTIKIKNDTSNKEICRQLWVLEEESCSPRLLFLQKDNQKALFSAEND